MNRKKEDDTHTQTRTSCAHNKHQSCFLQHVATPCGPPGTDAANEALKNGVGYLSVSSTKEQYGFKDVQVHIHIWGEGKRKEGRICKDACVYIASIFQFHNDGNDDNGIVSINPHLPHDEDELQKLVGIQKAFT